MTTKIVYNTNDDRFALVKWPSAKPKFTIVPMKQFEKSDEYELEKAYKFMYLNRKYTATVLYIGSEKECEAHEKLVTSYIVDDELKGKVTKSVSTKRSAEASNEIRKLAKQDLTESENEVLKEQLQRETIKNEQLEKRIEDLENQTKQLENDLVNAKRQSSDENKFSEQHKETLLHLATIINQTFSKEPTSIDFAEKQVSISPNYPEFKMSLSLRKHLCGLTEKSNTAVFRQLLDGVFNNLNVLAESNADNLTNNYPIIKACTDFMFIIRPDCRKQQIKKVLREKCAEARQKLWEKDPSLVFVVDGKHFKKTVKQEPSSSSISVAEQRETKSDISLLDESLRLSNSSIEDSDAKTDISASKCSKYSETTSQILKECNDFLNNEETLEYPDF